MRPDDDPQPTRRRSGEKEGGGPVMLRRISHPAGKPAARGNYAGLTMKAERPAFAAAAAAAVMAQRAAEMPGIFFAAAHDYLADTLDALGLVNQWDDDLDDAPDSDYDTQPNYDFPQP